MKIAYSLAIITASLLFIGYGRTLDDTMGYARNVDVFQGLPREAGEIPEIKVRVLPDTPENRTTFAVSAFSELDSCHNPIIDENGVRRCLTASGAIAAGNMCACPRKYPYGTIFEIDGIEYACTDRLAAKYDARIDLWQGYGPEGYQKAKNWGIRQKAIIVKMP